MTFENKHGQVQWSILRVHAALHTVPSPRGTTTHMQTRRAHGQSTLTQLSTVMESALAQTKVIKLMRQALNPNYQCHKWYFQRYRGDIHPEGSAGQPLLHITLLPEEKIK